MVLWESPQPLSVVRVKAFETSRLDAATFACATQRHWGIENRNHHIHDCILGEDDSRIRRQPGRFACLRSFTLNILRADGIVNVRRETLRSLGCRTLDNAEIADWLASIRTFDRGPVLIRAGRAARDWLNRAGVEPYNPAGFFIAACLWCEETANRPIPCPSGQRPSSTITG